MPTADLMDIKLDFCFYLVYWETAVAMFPGIHYVVTTKIEQLPAWLQLLTADPCTDQAKLALWHLHLQVQQPKSSHPQPINNNKL